MQEERFEQGLACAVLAMVAILMVGYSTREGCHILSMMGLLAGFASGALMAHRRED